MGCNYSVNSNLISGVCPFPLSSFPRNPAHPSRRTEDHLWTACCLNPQRFPFRGDRCGHTPRCPMSGALYFVLKHESSARVSDQQTRMFSSVLIPYPAPSDAPILPQLDFHIHPPGHKKLLHPSLCLDRQWGIEGTTSGPSVRNLLQLDSTIYVTPHSSSISWTGTSPKSLSIPQLHTENPIPMRISLSFLILCSSTGGGQGWKEHSTPTGEQEHCVWLHASQTPPRTGRAPYSVAPWTIRLRAATTYNPPQSFLCFHWPHWSSFEYLAGSVSPTCHPLHQLTKRKDWGPPRKKEFCLQTAFGLETTLTLPWVSSLPCKFWTHQPPQSYELTP